MRSRRSQPWRVFVLADALPNSGTIPGLLNPRRFDCQLRPMADLLAIGEELANCYDAVILGEAAATGDCDLPAMLADLTTIVIAEDDIPHAQRDQTGSASWNWVARHDLVGNVLERLVEYTVRHRRDQEELTGLTTELRSKEGILQQQESALADKNRRLAELHRISDRFVDNVSHEFRTPLTVVKDYIALVRDGLAGAVTNEQERMLDTAAVRADDLAQMIDDLLDTAKCDAGLLGAMRRNCQIADVIGRMQRGLEKRAAVLQVTLDVDCPRGLAEAYCDADQINRIVGNLVFNALRQAGRAGTVQLSVTENADDCELVIAVTDDGPGLDDAARHTIFERFQQVETGASSSTKGMGLGLNVARELIDLNLGELKVATVLGQGSTFSFTLPIAHPPEVMRRSLSRLIQERGSSANLSLILATVDAGAEGELAAADCFFNFVLRPDDLLFRVSESEWLLVAPAPPVELQRLCERIQQEYVQANDCRPHSPLPPFGLSVLGTWPAASGRAAMLERFNALFPARPLFLETGAHDFPVVANEDVPIGECGVCPTDAATATG